MRPLHVLLIHQVFTSTNEAGGTRHAELGARLPSWGHRMTVVAGHVSYLTGATPAAREKVDGIDVVRARAYSAWHRSFIARGIGFISFMFTSFVAALRVPGVDVVWGTVPPIFQGFSAYLVARLRRKPFLLEVRDLWPDFVVATGVLTNPTIIAVARRAERFLYRHADCVMVNSPGFIEHLVERGVARDAIELVPNGVDASMFDAAPRTESAAGEQVRKELGIDADAFIALYAGAQGIANDLGVVLDAARALADDPSIHIVFVGDGKERAALQARATAEHLERVHFVPAVPKDRMPAFLAAADVCIAILQPVKMFTTTYPNKVFDYMAAARPTILAIDGVIHEVIAAAGAGTFVAPGDPNAMAEALRAYRADPARAMREGVAARAYVTEHFDRDRQAEQLVFILERMGART